MRFQLDAQSVFFTIKDCPFRTYPKYMLRAPMPKIDDIAIMEVGVLRSTLFLTLESTLNTIMMQCILYANHMIFIEFM